MDQIHQRDKPLERTAKLTAKAGPKPWDIKQYTYEEPKDDQKPSHCDPRLEVAPQSHDPHQTDSDFIPSDDYGYGFPVFGTMHDLYARASSASELGTLAGASSSKEAEAKAKKEAEAKKEAARKKAQERAAVAAALGQNLNQQQKAAASKQRDSQAQSNKGQASHRKSK